MRNWIWIAPYLVVMAAAVLLGIGIAEFAVFKQATVGTPKLSAATLARFLGFATALVVFWLIAMRAARQMKEAPGLLPHLGFLIAPLATLVTLALAYDLVLGVLKPWLNGNLKDIYNWVFVAAISLAAIRLVVSLAQRSERVVELLKQLQPREREAVPCAACGNPMDDSANFCSSCGTATDPSRTVAIHILNS